MFQFLCWRMPVCHQVLPLARIRPAPYLCMPCLSWYALAGWQCLCWECGAVIRSCTKTPMPCKLLCATPAAGLVSPAEVATCSFSQARKLGAASQTQQAAGGSGSQAAPVPSAAAPSLPPWQEPHQQHSQQHQLAAPAGAAPGAAGLHNVRKPGSARQFVLPSLQAPPSSQVRQRLCS